ncbi:MULTISPECIES: efflux RND transporter periplasmic adaptor subunit [Thauera]|jgi:HlyD family secretion protein|uniref:Efflux RND transporter periplasmic adaptor subunit n=4 Tax=Thauera aminoaromatica TaxID=164330 RepID=A0A5C7TA23_THASP|nr:MULTISPECIES: efflux RND transporter periplasmic adaptor subunit [Thauera]OPZ03996.1 MAG: Macrolide export protein MacA [Alphaproteobacteria bacterium ADurb.BinA305]KIN90923.1 efflux transporter, RND family, MFP subunit [Thauera sp. SWB20]MBP6130479.1 efflux RND transporter periplasmic adaptor subunit [Thauera sp.]MBP7046494.1 efflux RND transporter periplasmic adaptor subunit [Thauera sp.]MCK6399936.1 efflux RND transporter periplasmic adaptor subunit [Thauera aminoaromatica]
MKTLRRLFVLALVAALVGAGIWWMTRPQPIEVAVHEVARGTVEATLTNTRAGEVEACQRAKMATIAGGRIEWLGVEEGDRVEAGQVLMRLWHGDLDARAAVVRAQLATARQRVQEACAVAANAEREAARQAQLVKRGFVSASAEERARTEARARRAACDTAQADIATAQAQLVATETERQRLVLVAPFAGTVAKISGELGEYATPSPPGVPMPPAIDLIDDSCLYVKAPMDEIDAPKIRPGLPVRITLEAIPGKVFEGRVRRVAPYITAVEKQARTVAVDVDFADPAEAHGMLVGYSTDVEIVLATRAEVLRVPTGALREGGKVLVVEGDTLVERTLRTGVANWEFTEVVSGLAAGERIVTSLEREGVMAGAKVALRPEEAR